MVLVAKSGLMSTIKRYPTDLTDAQWKLVEPLLPSDPPRAPGGRPPLHDKREIVNAILYQVRAGGSWRMLPKDLPAWQTVYGYFRDWGRDGTLDRIHDALRERVRSKQEERNPTPSAGIADSQSVKGADTVSAATRGYDAGKKINGRKRHIVVDTIGLLLVVMVTAAWSRIATAGGASSRRCTQLVAVAKSAWGIVVEVVKKPAEQIGFAVLPRRWVVERTFSWLMRFRRLARDYERLPAIHEAMVKWAMIALMLNRLAPPSRGLPSAPNDRFKTPSKTFMSRRR